MADACGGVITPSDIAAATALHDVGLIGVEPDVCGRVVGTDFFGFLRLLGPFSLEIVTPRE